MCPCILGFGEDGISACSCASCFQSCCYAGYTPLGGAFAACQSAGARLLLSILTFSIFLLLLIEGPWLVLLRHPAAHQTVGAPHTPRYHRTDSLLHWGSHSHSAGYYSDPAATLVFLLRIFIDMVQQAIQNTWSTVV